MSFFLLKGQCHEIFCFRFFHESPSPKTLIITLGSFWIFSKIRRDIHKSRCTTGVNDTGGKFAAGINDTVSKFATGIKDTGSKFCHRYQRHRWQIMGTISGCRHLKVNLKAKIYIYVSSTTQRWQNKIITPVANLELRISPRIFEKIRNCLNVILWGWGETDSWKEPEAKNLVTLSL